MFLQESSQDSRLAAAYVSRAQEALEPTELRRFLQERVPLYMAPTLYIQMAALPKSTSGKTDRRTLAALATPEAHPAREYVPPHTELERAIAAIWESVLHIEKPSMLDDFFQLGGHSVRGIQVVQRINQAFPVNLTLRSIFTEPTVAGLAMLVEEMILDKLESETSRQAV